jgi:hypothetical protein
MPDLSAQSLFLKARGMRTSMHHYASYIHGSNESNGYSRPRPSFDETASYVIASEAKQSPMPRIEIASSLRSSQ